MVTLCLLTSLGIRWHIQHTTRDARHGLAEAPSELGVALILGAKIWGDRPSHLLEDRLAAGLELYESGRCDQLLVSGAADEVEVMRAWLSTRGVPEEAILVDPAGLRTLDSMARARDSLTAEQSVVVVTQAFHLPRAVYLARHHGLDAQGVAAPAGYNYSAGLEWRNAAREHLAQARAWLDIHLLATGPHDPDTPIVVAEARSVP